MDLLGRTIEVKLQLGTGTEIDVYLCLLPATDHDMTVPRNEISLLRSKTLGKHSVILEPEPPRVATHHIIKLEETIRKTHRT
jgi:hypothetical protein